MKKTLILPVKYMPVSLIRSLYATVTEWLLLDKLQVPQVIYGVWYAWLAFKLSIFILAKVMQKQSTLTEILEQEKQS